MRFKFEFYTTSRRVCYFFRALELLRFRRYERQHPVQEIHGVTPFSGEPRGCISKLSSERPMDHILLEDPELARAFLLESDRQMSKLAGYG